MRPTRSYHPAPRPSVDQVISEARHALATARGQRDQLQAALREAQADNEALRHQLASTEGNRSDRLAADLENLRRRQTAEVDRARLETLTRAVEPLAEIIDHLGRALAAHPDPENPWFKGTAAILARSKASLHALGVETLGSIGERFDPALHEAVGTVHTPDLPSGSIVDVVKTGLWVADTRTLIRPAAVVVAEGGA